MIIDNYFGITVRQSGYLKTGYNKETGYNKDFDLYYEDSIWMLKRLSKGPGYHGVVLNMNLNKHLEDDKLKVEVRYKDKEHRSIDEISQKNEVEKDVVKLKREFNSIYSKRYAEPEALNIIKVNKNAIEEVLENVYLSLKSSKGLTSVETRLAYYQSENDIEESCRVFIKIKNAEEKIESEIELPIVELELNIHLFSLLNKFINNIINNRYVSIEQEDLAHNENNTKEN